MNKAFLELVENLKKIKEMGFIKTHRSGNTGIGKTLEDLLGIEENNIPGPNAAKIEIKSIRKTASAMLTLFTKSPIPHKANSALLMKYGYLSSRGNEKKELHTTVNAKNFNTLKGESGFKVDVRDNKIILINLDGETLGYWEEAVLKKSFERKLPQLLLVKAETQGYGSEEKFWFNEAWLLSRFDFSEFLDLIKQGIILIDIRIGQFPDGRTYDHGTGFRVQPNKLDLCFKKRSRMM